MNTRTIRSPLVATGPSSRALLLAVAFVVAGCGGDSSSPSSPTVPSAPAPAPTPAPPPAPAPEPGEQTYNAGQRISSFPQGSAAIGSIVGGGSLSLSGGNVTITLNENAYVEYSDFRYTCVAANCRIENGQVTQGQITRTAAGTAATGGTGGTTGSPTGGPSGGSANTFNSGDRIPGFPQGSAAIGSIAGGGSLSLSGGNVTITLNENAYVEYSDFRYTCVAANCRIENGRVTVGRIERTPNGVSATGGGNPSGGGGASGALEFIDGSTECELTGPEGVLNAICTGRVRALQAVRSVEVTGTIEGLDGDRKTHTFAPDLLGNLSAGQTATFTLTGTFSTTATRFDIGFEVKGVAASEAVSGTSDHSVITKAPTH